MAYLLVHLVNFYSFFFSKHFILVKVTVDPEPEGNCEYTLGISTIRIRIMFIFIILVTMKLWVAFSLISWSLLSLAYSVSIPIFIHVAVNLFSNSDLLLSSLNIKKNSFRFKVTCNKIAHFCLFFALSMVIMTILVEIMDIYWLKNNAYTARLLIWAKRSLSCFCCLGFPSNLTTKQWLYFPSALSQRKKKVFGGLYVIYIFGVFVL